MGIWEWTSQNWFNLLSAAGITGSLGFTAVALRSEARTRKVANLLAITANHREIWRIFIQDKGLSRILKPSTDITKYPITEGERAFVVMVLLHTYSVYFAGENELVMKLKGWHLDIAQLLSLPIPMQVWEEMKMLQDEKFVAFIESCRSGIQKN